MSCAFRSLRKFPMGYLTLPPAPVGWSSTEHGVLTADEDASRRRQRSPATKWQGASASGQLVVRPRWEQPTRCFFRGEAGCLVVFDEGVGGATSAS